MDQTTHRVSLRLGRTALRCYPVCGLPWLVIVSVMSWANHWPAVIWAFLVAASVPVALWTALIFRLSCGVEIGPEGLRNTMFSYIASTFTLGHKAIAWSAISSITKLHVLPLAIVRHRNGPLLTPFLIPVPAIMDNSARFRDLVAQYAPPESPLRRFAGC